MRTGEEEEFPERAAATFSLSCFTSSSSPSAPDTPLSPSMLEFAVVFLVWKISEQLPLIKGGISEITIMAPKNLLAGLMIFYPSFLLCHQVLLLMIIIKEMSCLFPT